MAVSAPLVGYNTNVRHKGRLFHIQTEDSGISHPHVITHLFADGGRIIATRKTAYREHLGAPDFPEIVRRIMKEQHKAMFVALRDGAYDEPSPSTVAAEVSPPRVATSPPSGVIEGIDPNAIPDGNPTPVDPSVIPPPPTPATPAAPPLRPASRPAIAAIAAPPARASAPPSAAPRPVAMPARAPSRPAPAPAPVRPPARPASRPAVSPAPKSIFGQDLISEKSLDEVILSYLSRDLEDGK